MNLSEIENEQYRRDILMFLESDTDSKMPNQLLIKALNSIGNPISNERLTEQLNWLKKEKLVELTTVETIILVQLTQAGLDVALCRTYHPHIAKPQLL